MQEPSVEYQQKEQQTERAKKWIRARRKTHDVLEAGIGNDFLSRAVNSGLVILILVNVIAFALETVPDFGKQYATEFYWLNLVSILIFTLEYILRIWSCVEVPGLDLLRAPHARMRFALRPQQVIDLVVILPFFLSFFFLIDLRILRALRLFRFFKLARYSPALQSLARVLKTEMRALLGALLVMTSLLLFSSTGIYFLEREVQPEYFGSIPQAAWWALATLTTVGYGDVVPITLLGKLFGGLVMLFGLGMFAMPIAIISTGFAQETGRREFVVTWSMVAHVPMFRGLTATELSEIMALLRSQSLAAGTVLFRAGDRARAMYFIVAGEVEIETEEKRITLGKGEFFGELAFLQQREHIADAVTISRSNLLVLNVEDLDFLLRHNPRLKERLYKIADKRMDG